MSNNSFSLENVSGNYLRTRGLSAIHYSDLQARIDNPDNEEQVREMLNSLARYQIEEEKVIRPGKQIPYGYWILKANEVSENLVELWELTPDGKSFLPGVETTLKYWDLQHNVCQGVNAIFTPPSPNQMIAISDGVLQGDYPIEGVRYSSPPHMSGWYLTTDRYNGDITTMQVEHLYHVTSSRSEIASFISLPVGYRFTISKLINDIWYDEKVAKENE